MPNGQENLIPFKKGYDARRGPGGGPSPLHDPEFVENFAKALATGCTNAELEETFSIGNTSVKAYKKDPRVKNAAMKFIDDRVIQITRRIDGEIEQRLQFATNMTLKELLAVRKEFLGPSLRLTLEKGEADAATVNAAQQALEDDPELMAAFDKITAAKE